MFTITYSLEVRILYCNSKTLGESPSDYIRLRQIYILLHLDTRNFSNSSPFFVTVFVVRRFNFQKKTRGEAAENVRSSGAFFFSANCDSCRARPRAARSAACQVLQCSDLPVYLKRSLFRLAAWPRWIKVQL